jgi:hypothetical protein
MVSRALSAATLFFAAIAAPMPGAAQDAAVPAALIDDLNALIEKGERERLADPWFLQDLRDVVSKYDTPWRTPLFSTDFGTDGPVPAPWRVVSGEMRVDWRHGLRALVRAPEASASAGSQSESRSGGDPGAQILGAILKGVLDAQRNGGSGDQTPPEAQPDETTEAVALAETAVTNAFRITASIGPRALSDGSAAVYELGVYQNADAEARPGYFLTFDEAGGEVTLTRRNSRGGVAIVDVAALPPRADAESVRSVVWSRHPDGRTTLSVDDAPLIDTTDRGFRDPWNGVVYSVRRGDVGLKSVAVLGTAS